MTVTIEEAQARLGDLITKAARGEAVVITRDEKPIARLVAEKSASLQPRVPGSAKGMIAYMADDFDAPLDNCKEYME
jgi:prevent-host-death family protein